MAQQMIRRIQPFLLVLILALVLSGCTVLPGTKGVDTRKKPPIELKEQPIQVAHRAYITAEVRSDVTSSTYYPSQYFAQAIQKTADAIDKLVQLNSDGATIYVGLLNSNSFRPESTVMVITIGSLPADKPHPVLKPVPAYTNNPQKDGEDRKQVEDENDKMLRDWQNTLAQNHARLKQVKAQVKQQTDQLRRLNPPVDRNATDVYGMLERASLHLQSAPPGIKMLLIESSDMQNTTLSQVTADLHLKDVQVRVLFHTCQNAPECLSNDAFWAGVLTQAGVKDQLWLDPAASLARDDLFA